MRSSRGLHGCLVLGQFGDATRKTLGKAVQLSRCGIWFQVDILMDSRKTLHTDGKASAGYCLVPYDLPPHAAAGIVRYITILG